MRRKKLPHDPRFARVDLYHTDVRATIRREQLRLKRETELKALQAEELAKKVKPFKPSKM